jgi:hypothetical protein
MKVSPYAGKPAEALMLVKDMIEAKNALDVGLPPPAVTIGFIPKQADPVKS